MMRTLLLTTALLGVLSLPAIAQDSVPVRAGAHDTHTRVVFDWPASTPYKVTQSSPGQISVTFDREGTLNTSAVTPDTVVSGITASGSTATINVTSGTTYRHFVVGNKVVLDIFKPGAEGKSSSSPASSKVTPPKVDAPVKEVAVAPPPPAKAAPEPVVPAGEKPDVAHAPPAANEGPAVAAHGVDPVEKNSIQSAMSEMAPHVITVSATESFGMAAFVHNGKLWVVTDRPTANVPPQIAGPEVSRFPAFQRVDIPAGGVAYNMIIPRGISPELRAEGGGLVWRLIIPTTRTEDKSVKLDRQFDSGQTIRGGTAFWPMTGVSKIIDMTDPDTGEAIKVATVSSSTQAIGDPLDFVDFSSLESVVGAAIIPKVDDLSVKFDPKGLSVTRPTGLAMSRDKDVGRRIMRTEMAHMDTQPQTTEDQAGMRRIFDFDRWMMGGLTALTDNERILKSTLSTKQPQDRAQDLLTLAKMSIANDRGQEALGYLSIAEDDLPALTDSPEYMALRGSAYALSGKHELAWKDFSNPALNDFGELGYWKAYTLAWLEDWAQAYKELPKTPDILAGYPKPLLEKMGVRLAEVALRGGDTNLAERILMLLERDRSTLKPWTIAGLDYLRGEAKRQNKDIEGARKLWDPLVEGRDRFYRARSGLALTLLELQDGKINLDKAIDRLEGLRYAWRGDELEAQINYMLGRLYLDQNKYVKGFSILRDASTMALPDSNIGKEITGYMTSAYQDLIVQDKDLTPLDAATIYEEFKELTPPGEEGNAVIQRLAERLVEVDLLNRASALLQHQVDYRLQGSEKARVATRLAAIYLLDKNPRPAIAALDAAQAVYAADTAMPEATRKEHDRELALLRARALSKINRTEEAILLLNQFEPDPDINHLRADISWQAGLWEDAEEALQDLILDESLDPNRPLSLKQADLLLNRAVALNLAGNRVALANMRTQYQAVMDKTERGKMFEVITRPRKVASLADRETISSIVSEVDLFKDFLDTYRKSEESEVKPEAAAPATAPAPAAEPEKVSN